MVDRSDGCAAFQSHLYRLQKWADRNIANFQVWKYRALYLRKNKPNALACDLIASPQPWRYSKPTGNSVKQPIPADLLQKQGGWTEKCSEVPSDHNHSIHIIHIYIIFYIYKLFIYIYLHIYILYNHLYAFGQKLGEKVPFFIVVQLDIKHRFYVFQ